VIRALLFLLLAGALGAYAFWVYLRAELPVGGRRLLALLRTAVLLLVLALLFDVRLPWASPPGARGRWALLDASLSMGAGDGGAWREASERARALAAEGWTVVPFGQGVASDDPSTPEQIHTDLAPALTRATEAGVGEVRVLSDLRLEDPVEVAATLAATPISVAFERFGGNGANAGVSDFTVSDQHRAGDPVTGEVGLFAQRADSVEVRIHEEGRLVLDRQVAAPAPGLEARRSFELPPPEEEGRLRYTVTVRVPGDGFASDDQGVAYMSAGHEAGGLVVVSLRPDWEPRALLPVLDEATGLRGTGYLRVGADRFAPMGRAPQRGETVDSARVGAAVADAALVVIHGLGASADAWARGLVRRNARLLVWPDDPGGADLAGVDVGPPRQGEWYASDQVGASPLAADLAGARLQDLPPLGPLLPLSDGPPPDEAPLLVQLGGTGQGRPALTLHREAGRREVVVLASGFWRWDARGGPGRDAYRRLWSGVAGWLLAPDPSAVVREVRPERWVFARGATVRFRLPGAAADSIRLEIRTASTPAADTAGGSSTPSDSVVADTTFTGVTSATLGTFPPGTYRFAATGPEGSLGEGRFDVEARTGEMLPRSAEPDSVRASGPSSVAAPGRGRPLRTTPWPYLLVLVLLCAEWIARRRAGLR
jgi:hypothetical protein